MVDTNNPEFQIALREFDVKRYEKVEKLCNKMIEKNPKDDQALALKGLNFLYLNKPDEGEKTLKQALKANFKSAVAWHFYAIFQKERGNYSQAMKSYNKALAQATTNYNIIRDLSYMQLYMRQLNSFYETCRLAIDNKPGILLNWVSFAFGCVLVKNYRAALQALNSTEKIGANSLKKNEIHEIKLFNSFINISLSSTNTLFISLFFIIAFKIWFAAEILFLLFEFFITTKWKMIDLGCILPIFIKSKINTDKTFDSLILNLHNN